MAVKMFSKSANIILSVALFLSMVSVLLMDCYCEASLPSYQGHFTQPFGRSNYRRFLADKDSSEEDLDNYLSSIKTFKRSELSRFKALCATEFERYDPITQDCFEVGTQGPCGLMKIFRGNEYLNPEDKLYGHCECHQGRYDRPMVSVQGKCYFLYTQAICDPGYFLVLKRSIYGTLPACQLNPCANAQKYSPTELIPFKDHCVKLNSHSILCPDKNDTVTFKTGSFEPVCTTTITSSRRLFRRQITKTNELKCQEGYGKVRGSSRCYRLVRIAKSNSR